MEISRQVYTHAYSQLVSRAVESSDGWWPSQLARLRTLGWEPNGYSLITIRNNIYYTGIN